MDFSILPYDQLPKYIKENENLRQILLQSGGIMKYIAEHIDDPTDDDVPLLFVRYQNSVVEDYRKTCRWNPNRQSWSVEDFRQRALNGRNHLWSELQSRLLLMPKLRMLADLSFDAVSMLDRINWKYLEYAWKEDLRRRCPDIDTDLGTYKYVMQQFVRFRGPMISDGLACRSIDIALKIHHGYELTETDGFDSFNIEMFHAHFFGPTIIDRFKRGLAELLSGKPPQEFRTEAISMLQSVKWFSQHIYNDEVKDVLNDSFTLEDKRWLRSLLEHYDRDRFGEDELRFFYFGKLFEEIGRVWDKWALSCPDFELCDLEKEANSIINANPFIRPITWEDEKQCFKNAVLRIMRKKKNGGGYLFEDDSQWIAVYRLAVDKSIMYDINDPMEPQDKTTPQYEKFANFAEELQLDKNPPTRHPFLKKYIKDLNSKTSYKRYNTHHPWSQEGMTDPRSLAFYTKMDNIYKALEDEYSVLILHAEQDVN